ncbi:prephenate dehydrogenase/arogenate dehydrogenase family protein [Micromonospora soli]|uniref:prephenate dehydrogenase n=1 Tax=Micromonospora sp. NBRC 110009 TaxID=3061627 RepID=UPI0026714A53|nr:prephenate dehydrogenase/arogenate dehydrogenase family protein [Micromonospora sp. NBRC 110009]WKU01833.1 prephenate dehydrogenase/arogenate dehydrogenase family protein [Micromonospora sp. NBRC 110009]
MTDGATRRGGPSTVDPPAAGVRAAVVGTGLIGGSLLLRLRDVGLDVAGWDPDPATRAHARRWGVPCPDTMEEAVAGRDVVFLCGPLPTLPEMLPRVAAATDERCVLTDVGSTKAEVATAATAQGLGHRFVPGHPMAGADRAGLAAADPGLLVGAAWVLCPGPNGIAAFRRLAALLIEVFRVRVVPMSAPEHDAAAALSSHLPHLLAGALAGAVQRSALRDAVLALAAGSFTDGTRVAGGPPQRTANMLLGNRGDVLTGLASVRAVLDELADALRAGDAAALTARLDEGRTARAALGQRPFGTHQREFRAAADHAGELAYLREVGAAGGHLSGCRMTAGGVIYTAHLPQPPAAA